MTIPFNLLICPKCKTALERRDTMVFCSNYECSYGNDAFLTIDNKLVLVDFDNSVINRDSIINSNASSLVKRTIRFTGIKKAAKFLLSGSSKTTEKNLAKCSNLLRQITNPKILIVGGGTIGASCEFFFDEFKSSIISFDVYNSVNIDFVADGHSIPLKDGVVDLVILQAVLEHVFSPQTVVSECQRVLRDGGYVYAETPFLQHVHEGAYDFTRYTVLGHRILFKQFEVLSTGFVGGSGQTLLWSIEHFIGGIFRNRIIGKVVKGCFFWVRWLEKTIPDRYNIDGACGSYFLGRKSERGEKKGQSEYLKEYQGAQT